MLKFFSLPFATTGDKTAVPDAVDSNGNVSYSQGYGFDYQRQKTDPAAKNIERDKMNQILFDITTAIAEIQSQGVPDFITTALNGGAPYSYAQYAIVRYLGELYISLVAANTELPTNPLNWAPFSNVLRGLGVTAPQFDNDTSLATTAFVQRALGNMAGASFYTNSGTLAASDFGKLVNLSKTTPITIAMPSTVGVLAGASMRLFNPNDGAVTLTVSGGIVFSGAGNGASSYVLTKGQTVTAVWDGGNFVLTEGAGPASLSANGYQKLPSGLIIQWIHITALGTQGASSNWPIAFPTACVFAGVYCQNGSSPQTVSLGAKTTTTVTAYAGTVPVNIGFIGIGY